MEQVPVMGWELRGNTDRTQSNDGKGGEYLFLFLNWSDGGYHVHANISQSKHFILYGQPDTLIKGLDEDLEPNEGLLSVVDNAKEHQKALKKPNEWGYYRPTSVDEA